MLALAGMRHKERISVTIIGEGDFSETLKEMIESLRLGGVVEFDNSSYPTHSISGRMNEL